MRRRVFISYRRDDDGGDAGRLCDRLRKRFGHRRVFFDIDSIRPSEDFPTTIRRAVGSCDALVVVIGRNWVRAPRDPSAPKTDDPDDFVRIEVAAALERGIPTIPVLIDGAQMPPASQLPPSLESLATRHALEVSRKRWDYDIGLLIEAVEDVTSKPRLPVWIKFLVPVTAAVTAVTGAALARNGDPNASASATSVPAMTVPATTVPATAVAAEVAKIVAGVAAGVAPAPSDDPLVTDRPTNRPTPPTPAPKATNTTKPPTSTTFATTAGPSTTLFHETTTTVPDTILPNTTFPPTTFPVLHGPRTEEG